MYRSAQGCVLVISRSWRLYWNWCPRYDISASMLPTVTRSILWSLWNKSAKSSRCIRSWFLYYIFVYCVFCSEIFLILMLFVLVYLVNVPLLPSNVYHCVFCHRWIYIYIYIYIYICNAVSALWDRHLEYAWRVAGLADWNLTSSAFMHLFNVFMKHVSWLALLHTVNCWTWKLLLFIPICLVAAPFWWHPG